MRGPSVRRLPAQGVGEGGAGRCPGGGYLEGTLGTPPAAESLLEVKTKEDARQ